MIVEAQGKSNAHRQFALLQDVFDHFGRIVREGLAQADRAAPMQHDLLVIELDDLIVAEPEIGAVGAVIRKYELAEVEIDAGMLA